MKSLWTVIYPDGSMAEIFVGDCEVIQFVPIKRKVLTFAPFNKE